MEYSSCIRACTDCAIECEGCGHKCIQDRDRPQCALSCIDCAAICWQAAASIARLSPFVHQNCEHCAVICDACAEECARHDNEHCRHCAEVCLRCAEECRRMAHSVAA